MTFNDKFWEDDFNGFYRLLMTLVDFLRFQKQFMTPETMTFKNFNGLFFYKFITLKYFNRLLLKSYKASLKPSRPFVIPSRSSDIPKLGLYTIILFTDSYL